MRRTRTRSDGAVRRSGVGELVSKVTVLIYNTMTAAMSLNVQYVYLVGNV
jgi:hypothetical protein